MGCIAIMMSELQEIRNVYQGLETLYQTYLPKVDPELLHDLLIREEEKSERAPFYMVEVFTKADFKTAFAISPAFVCRTSL